MPINLCIECNWNLILPFKLFNWWNDLLFKKLFSANWNVGEEAKQFVVIIELIRRFFFGRNFMFCQNLPIQLFSNKKKKKTSRNLFEPAAKSKKRDRKRERVYFRREGFEIVFQWQYHLVITVWSRSHWWPIHHKNQALFVLGISNIKSGRHANQNWTT